MLFKIPKKVVSCLIFAFPLPICCICTLTIFIATNPVTQAAITDLSSQGFNVCTNKYMPDGMGLDNISNPEIFTVGYKSTQDLLNNYPWYGQYIFGSPGEPYCNVNINPFYAFTSNWKTYDENMDNIYKKHNIEDQIGKLDPDETVFYNEDGFIVIKKINNLYYSRGFHGYYSVP